MPEEMQLPIWNFDQPLTHLQVLKAFPSPMYWYTRQQIATFLRRAKSPTLVLKLTDLAADGFLDIKAVQMPNRVDMFVYRLTEEGCRAVEQGAIPMFTDGEY